MKGNLHRNVPILPRKKRYLFLRLHLKVGLSKKQLMLIAIYITKAARKLKKESGTLSIPARKLGRTLPSRVPSSSSTMTMNFQECVPVSQLFCRPEIMSQRQNFLGYSVAPKTCSDSIPRIFCRFQEILSRHAREA